MSRRIGTDIGGTFTDVAVIDTAGVGIFKAPSTPADPIIGLRNALAKAAAARGLALEELLADCAVFVHGTTIATNVLLEGKGACVGLLTTAGFRDSLAIRRGRREHPWDHRRPNPPLLVPRWLRLGINERVDKHGVIERPVDPAEVTAASRTFREAGVESVAVCLFNAFLNPGNEREIGRLLRAVLPGIAVTLSTDILPVLGEYERTSTAVVNAYVAPRTSRYLEALSDQLTAARLAAPLLVTQNGGGLAVAREAAARPAALTVSGPAAGAAAAALFGRLIGEQNIISLDMGGTSCDLTLIRDGQAASVDELTIGGYHIAIPSVDVGTVGAGGGTIGWVDPAGLLRMGPRSAGADPGPACYDRGGSEPTSTDAHLVLGRLDPSGFLGGEIPLNAAAACRAIERHVATPLGLDLRRAAAGMLRILNARMASAIRLMTVQRGDDPRRFCLIAAGGAGALHASALARELGIGKVYVPRGAAAYCATGMLEAPRTREYREPLVGPLLGQDPAAITRTLEGMMAHGRAALRGDDAAFGPITVLVSMALRYSGQQGSLPVPVALPLGPGSLEALERSFHKRHAEVFGFERPGDRVEAMEVRLEALRPAPPLALSPAPPSSTRTAVLGAAREAYVDDLESFADTAFYAGGQLSAGHVIAGPAVVAEPASTIAVGAYDQLEVDAYGNYLLTIGVGHPIGAMGGPSR